MLYLPILAYEGDIYLGLSSEWCSSPFQILKSGSFYPSPVHLQHFVVSLSTTYTIRLVQGSYLAIPTLHCCIGRYTSKPSESARRADQAVELCASPGTLVAYLCLSLPSDAPFKLKPSPGKE